MVALYRQFPLGINDTSFEVKYQNILVRSHQLNYKDIFVGTQIQIRYVVISIVLITVMLAIELLYLTQLFSFLGCFFDYLTLFIPIGLLHILNNV